MVPPPVQSAPRRRFPWGILVIVAGVILLALAINGYQAGGQRENAELDAATARARAELPTFIAAVRDPKPTQRFFVRGGFGPDKAREILWVRNVRYDGENFRGTLDQEPALYRQAHRGDEVVVPPSKVFDWAIKDGPRLLGGYTESVKNHS